MTEVLEYIRGLCNTYCDSSYNDVLPNEVTNACAVRLLTTSDRVNLLSGNTAYKSAMVQVLYRGTQDRATSLDIAENIADILDKPFNIELTNTYIIQMHSENATFGFMDDNKNANYSITIDLEYARKD